MDADRIKVLHRTDGKYIAAVVAHNFKLNFLPAGYTLFHQYLMNGRTVQTVLCNLFKLCMIFRNTAARSAKRKRWPYNHRIADTVVCKIKRILQCRYDF